MNRDAACAADPIQLKAVTVSPGRLTCDIVIPDERFRYTTSELAALVVESYPELPHHACVNGAGPSFGAVIENTSVPHLLEHVAITLQTRSAIEQGAEFVGTTEWACEAAGDARIVLSFADDLEALRAFIEATRFLNIAVLTCLA